MARHSSTLAWKIPWMEEPGRLQSMESRRVGHDWITSLSLSCVGKGNGNPLQCSCLENPRDGGAWWAAIYGVAQSWTWLKRLSSSSSSSGFTISVSGFPQGIHLRSGKAGRIACTIWNVLCLSLLLLPFLTLSSLNHYLFFSLSFLPKLM